MLLRNYWLLDNIYTIENGGHVTWMLLECSGLFTAQTTPARCSERLQLRTIIKTIS